ncbi:MAG: hypothetical protein HFJ41_02350 [Clostridia bacterium]|jgi:predicted XRE-type DNA-binding protein|nr:hypothetical protein [Clostridia bacterium]
METNNTDIRIWAFQNNVRMYEIAEKLGIHYVTLSTKLRKELNTEEKQKIFKIIDQIKQEKGGK